MSRPAVVSVPPLLMIAAVLGVAFGLVALLLWLRFGRRAERSAAGDDHGRNAASSHSRGVMPQDAPRQVAGTAPAEADTNGPPPLAVKGSSKKSTLVGTCA